MPININDYEPIAEILKAMAHPMRVCILNRLSSEDSISVNYMKDCLTVPQSTLSQQLGILRRAGLVRALKDGREVSYAMADDRVKAMVSNLINNLEEMTNV